MWEPKARQVICEVRVEKVREGDEKREGKHIIERERIKI